jgi:membrane-associated phospholipid phosphatase
VLHASAALALTLALQTTPALPPEIPPLPPDKPIEHIVQNLGHDIAHLPSLDTLAIAGSGVLVAAVAHQADDRVATWAADQGPAGYTSAGRRYGDGWTQGGVALATYGVGLLTRDRMTIHIGSDLIRAQVLNAVLTRGIKLVANRDRPGGSSDSMPSGHTTATFATATVLQEHFGWKAGAPAFALGAFTGWTRIRDHAHWVSDVLVGASVGIIAGHTVASGHRGRQWAVVPVASGQMTAIYVVRVAR